MKINQIVLFSIILVFLILGLDFFTKSGFYLFLDTVFYPIYEIKGLFSQTFFWKLLDLGSFTFGYKLFSKIYFVMVLSVGIFLGYKIGKFIADFFFVGDKNALFFLQAISITFAISSPFIYERLVSQTHIALGIFCIGIGFVYLLEFICEKRKLLSQVVGNELCNKNKKFYIAALFFSIAFSIFPHTVVFVALIAFFTLFFFFRYFSIKSILFAFTIFIALNLNWIFGTFLFQSVEYGVRDTVATLDQKNIDAFIGNSLGSLGVEITHLFGYGFWGEKFNHIIRADTTNPYFWLFGCIIYIMVIVGAYQFWKRDKKITCYLLTLAIFSYILALGISSPLASPLNQFLYDTIPYYVGMREPGKLLGLMTIIFLIFFGFGAYISGSILKKIHFDIRDSYNLHLYLLVIFFIINAFNPNMFFGFKGQLNTVIYPKEYFDSRKYLQEKDYTKNLIFPWHSYMSCKWKGPGIFSNTYPNILYFPDTIKADNIEVGDLYTNYDNPQSEIVENFLKERNVAILRKLGIQTIILQYNCADADRYKYLETLEGLEKVFDRKYLKIYKINYYDKK